MAHLLVGSEGTLGFFTAIEVDLQPVPPHRVLGVCHFPRFRDAMDAVPRLVALDPDAVELVDRTIIELGRGIQMFRETVSEVVQGRPDALLLVEFAGGDRAAALLSRLEALDGCDERSRPPRRRRPGGRSGAPGPAYGACARRGSTSSCR